MLFLYSPIDEYQEHLAKQNIDKTIKSGGDRHGNSGETNESKVYNSTYRTKNKKPKKIIDRSQGRHIVHEFVFHITCGGGRKNLENESNIKEKKENDTLCIYI